MSDSFATPQTAAHQSPLSMGFPRQAYWSGLTFPSPGKKVIVKSLSRVQLFAILWTIGHQAPLSMGFPRQEYWSGLPFSSLGDLPNPGIEPGSSALASSLPLREQNNMEKEL